MPADNALRLDAVLSAIASAAIEAAPDGWCLARFDGAADQISTTGGVTYELPDGEQRGFPDCSDQLWELAELVEIQDAGIDLELTVRPSGRFGALITPRMRTISGAYLHLLDPGHLPPEPGEEEPGPTDATEAGDAGEAVRLLHECLRLRAEIRGSEDPLNPPAAADRLTEVEQRYGVRLPADLRALYTVADGVADDALLFDGHTWLPLGEVLARVAARERHWSGWDLSWNKTVLEAHPAGTVRRVTGHPAWIPFAHDGGGDFLAVDMAPAVAGRPGQVIEIGRAHGTRPRYVADSVTALLRRHVQAMEAGDYFHEDGYLELDLDSPGASAGPVSARIGADVLSGAMTPGLQELSVGGGAETVDLEPLRAAPYLRELQIWCGTADLSPLRDLPVETLKLTVEAVDLAPLAGHPTLRTLALRTVGPADLGPLATLPRLRGLDLSEVPELTDPAVLGGLKGLRYLSLRYEQWQDLRARADVPPALAAACLTGPTPRDRVIEWARAFDGRPREDEVLRREGQVT